MKFIKLPGDYTFNAELIKAIQVERVRSGEQLQFQVTGVLQTGTVNSEILLKTFPFDEEDAEAEAEVKADAQAFVDTLLGDINSQDIIDLTSYAD